MWRSPTGLRHRAPCFAAARCRLCAAKPLRGAQLHAAADRRSAAHRPRSGRWELRPRRQHSSRPELLAELGCRVCLACRSANGETPGENATANRLLNRSLVAVAQRTRRSGGFASARPASAQQGADFARRSPCAEQSSARPRTGGPRPTGHFVAGGGFAPADSTPPAPSCWRNLGAEFASLIARQMGSVAPALCKTDCLRFSRGLFFASLIARQIGSGAQALCVTGCLR